MSRYIEGGGDKRNLLRVLSSRYFNILCRLMLRQNIRDFTTSIFLMKRQVLDEVNFIKTPRPKDMRMNVEKIEKILGVDMPLLIDEIKLVSKEYKSEL